MGRGYVNQLHKIPFCVLEVLLFGHCVEGILKGGQSEGRDPLRRIISFVLARDGDGLRSREKWTDSSETCED